MASPETPVTRSEEAALRTTAAGGEADPATALSGRVFEMRMAQAAQSPPATPAGDATAGQATTQTSDRPDVPLTANQSEFNRFLEAVKTNPGEHVSYAKRINIAIMQADGRFYEAMNSERTEMAQLQPAYGLAQRQINSGYADARKALGEIPDDKRAQAISDVQKYMFSPTDELRTRLQSYGQAGADLLAAVATKIIPGENDKSYIAGEQLKERTNAKMQDSIAFRDQYGELLADHLHMSGKALPMIWDRQRKQREMQERRYIAPE